MQIYKVVNEDQNVLEQYEVASIISTEAVGVHRP